MVVVVVVVVVETLATIGALAGTKITFVGTRFTWFDWVGRVVME